MIARAEDGVVGGVPVQIACLADSLLVASLHVVNDLWKADASLLSWRDVIVLQALLGPDKAAAVFSRAKLSWFRPYVEASIAAITGSNWSPEPIAAPKIGQMLRLHWLGWSGDSLPARHPLGWTVRLPALNAALFAVGSAVPSPWYARKKHAGYMAYWRESFRSLRGAIKGTDFRVVGLQGRPARTERPADEATWG